MYTTLISAQQLQALQLSGQPCMVFDCSFELMQPGAGEQQYQQAHIPGAVRADLDLHLSAAKTAPDAASGGRHPCLRAKPLPPGLAALASATPCRPWSMTGRAPTTAGASGGCSNGRA